MEHLASGRTADIYAWDAGRVVKIFKDGFGAAAAYEARIAAVIARCNPDAPAVGDLIEVDGRPALIYQRIDGPTMRVALQQQGDPALITTLADLHVQLHTRRCPDLPSLHTRLATNIAQAPVLTPSVRAALLARLESMPRADVICHGDFHPENVVMTARGPVVIDWHDATSGPALADVARTWLLFTTAARQDAVFGPFIEALRDKYLERYRQQSSISTAGIANWLPLLAAARLNEGVAGEQDWLLATVHAAL